MPHGPNIAVLGSGPAGLMAADTLVRSGASVTLFEKRKSLGRKLLVAGSSGLNVSYDATDSELVENYRGPKERLIAVFSEFGVQAWLAFLKSELGLKTFTGTSRRHFVQNDEGSAQPGKASGLLTEWQNRLARLGVVIMADHELIDFDSGNDEVILKFEGRESRKFDAAILALGGGSWEPKETPVRWLQIFSRKKIECADFTPSNCGYEIDWPNGLLDEAEGKPLKNVELTTSLGARRGELVITRYGLEGTPVYTLGIAGKAELDLKPDSSIDELLKLLQQTRENLSPMRRVQKLLGLSDAAKALVFHMTPAHAKNSLSELAHVIKYFPLHLKGPRPLQEAISSAGGVKFSELDENWMFKKSPRVFAAGEMLDWDAPTGGFLIQASVSQGHFVAKKALELLSADDVIGPSRR